MNALLLVTVLAQLTPGTVKLLSKNGTSVDPGTGDAYVQISPAEPAKFLIVGPGRLQADMRVNIAAGQTQGPVSVEVLLAGKSLQRFRVDPKPGTVGWKDRTDVMPSMPVGFYMEIDPGPHAYEVRVSGAAKGAGLFLVSSTKARRPLAGNAPVIPAKPPAPAVAPTAAPTPAAGRTAVAAGPTPKPTPAQGGTSLDQISTAGGTRADSRMERLSYEVAFKTGLMVPQDDAFGPAIASAAEVRWNLGDARAFGLGLEVGALQLGGKDANDPRRADPRAAVNVALVPVAVHATWWVPMDGRLRPYLAAGPGFVYAQSTVDERNRTLTESTIAPLGEALLGVQLDLAPGDLREGRQKLFLEAKGTYFLLDFDSHEHEAFSAAGVLLGIEMKF